MRINKYISNKGFCSRREAARVIEVNRVTINGIPSKYTDQVNEGDLVLVDGESIKDKADLVYIDLNKTGWDNLYSLVWLAICFYSFIGLCNFFFSKRRYSIVKTSHCCFYITFNNSGWYHRS